MSYTAKHQKKRTVVVGKTRSGKTATQRKQMKKASSAGKSVKVMDTKKADTKEKRLMPYTNQYGSRS